MANHSSARTRAEAPHVTQTLRANNSEAIRRRAQAILRDRTIDAESRAWIRYSLEIDDPWLAELVRRIDAGETITDGTYEDDPTEENIETFVNIICRDGADAATRAAALLVLMAMLENATHSKVLANIAKHLAFTRCGELNLNDMVDAQIAVLEAELLAGNRRVC